MLAASVAAPWLPAALSTVGVGTLKIAASLDHARLLLQELVNFQAKITDAANVVTGAWREGAHDDLVLALALALWYEPLGNSAVGAFG